MKGINLISVLLLLIYGCKCEGTFITISFLENKTKEAITFKMYEKSILKKTYVMANSEKIKVGESSGRSRTIAPNSGGFFLEGDSITIVYQGKVYYYNTGTITGGIPWEDSKNIINPKNYNFINRILDTKCDLETEAIFRFDDSMFQ